MTSSTPPPEVWLEIMEMVNDPNTLAQLALASSSFLPLARSVLYRSVHLDRSSSTDNMLDTVHLLERDIDLAVVVERLRFRHDGGHTHALLDLLQGLPRVKAITFIEHSVIGESSLVPYVKVIQESCPLLEELRYEGPEDYDSDERRDHSKPFQVDPLTLSGLKRISWADPFRLANPGRLPIIQLSRTTLTHISFPGNIDPVSYQLRLQLLQFRFPNLTTFILGSFPCATPIELNKTLSHFLLTHPTIEVLSLGLFGQFSYGPSLYSNVLQPTMLPRLRVLGVRGKISYYLLRCGLESFSHLTTLAIEERRVERAVCRVSRFTSQLREEGTILSSLEHVQFSPAGPSQLLGDNWHARAFLDGLFKVAPNVTRLSVIASPLDERNLTTVIPRHPELIRSGYSPLLPSDLGGTNRNNPTYLLTPMKEVSIPEEWIDLQPELANSLEKRGRLELSWWIDIIEH